MTIQHWIASAGGILLVTYVSVALARSIRTAFGARIAKAAAQRAQAPGGLKAAGTI